MRSQRAFPLLAAAGGSIPLAALAQDAGPSVVLWDQRADPSGQFADVLSYPIQDEYNWLAYDYDYDTSVDTEYYDAEGGDDFIVPSGERWEIDKVFIAGRQGGGTVGATQMEVEGINVAIWTNEGGRPGSVVTDVEGTVCDFPAASVESVSISMTADLPTPCVLNGGRYWVAVSVIMPYANSAGDERRTSPPFPAGDVTEPVESNGQYQWLLRPVRGFEAVFRNPGGGWQSSFTPWPEPFCGDEFGRMQTECGSTQADGPIDFRFAILGRSNLGPDAGVIPGVDASIPEDGGVIVPGEDGGVLPDGGPVADAAVPTDAGGGVVDGGGAVSDAGVTEDGGVTLDGGAVADAGPGPAPEPDAGDLIDAGVDGGQGSTGGGGGCNCDTTGGGDRKLGLLGLATLALGFVRRRRTRAKD